MPPLGPSSRTHTGRDGSARPGCWLASEKAVAAAVWSGASDSTVTARLGTVLSPALRTVIRSSVFSASRCVAGNVARVTFTGKVPDGSSESWRSPPPHPASATARSAGAPAHSHLLPRPFIARNPDTAAPLHAPVVERSLSAGESGGSRLALVCGFAYACGA